MVHGELGKCPTCYPMLVEVPLHILVLSLDAKSRGSRFTHLMNLKSIGEDINLGKTMKDMLNIRSTEILTPRFAYEM